MGGADFARAEYSPRRFVTSFFQTSKDIEEYGGSILDPVDPPTLGADDSLDVLKEDEGGPALLDSLVDVGEEMTGVLGGLALACV